MTCDQLSSRRGELFLQSSDVPPSHRDPTIWIAAFRSRGLLRMEESEPDALFS